MGQRRWGRERGWGVNMGHWAAWWGVAAYCHRYTCTWTDLDTWGSQNEGMTRWTSNMALAI